MVQKQIGLRNNINFILAFGNDNKIMMTNQFVGIAKSFEFMRQYVNDTFEIILGIQCYIGRDW